MLATVRIAGVTIGVLAALAGAVWVAQGLNLPPAPRSFMTADRTWFARKRDDKPGSEGMERLYVELGALELQAKDGKADLSKVQLESVIVWVVKQKFPPRGLVIPPQVVTPITPTREKQ